MGRKIGSAEVRDCFLQALQMLSPLDHSPLKLLEHTYFPRWRDAVYPKPSDGRYVGAIVQGRRLSKGRVEVLEEWAVACHLVSTGPDGKAVPAGWIVDYASSLCHREGFRVQTTSGEWDGLPSYFLHGENSVSETPTTRMPFLLPPGYPSLTEPEPLPGETWKHYRRRMCADIKKHFNACQIAAKRPAAPVARTRERKRAGHELDAYEWFILYQCLGWSLKDVGAWPFSVPTGSGTVQQKVWSGIDRVAKATGLKVIRRRGALKKPSG